jgi:hypothetical protein
MAETITIEVPLERKTNVGNASTPLTWKPPAETSLSTATLKSILVFGSTGVLVFFCVIAILPSKS